MATLPQSQPAVVPAPPQRPDRTAPNDLLVVAVPLMVVLVLIVLVIIDRALEGPGKLRVTSSPAVPTQILLDGQIADSWGVGWLKVVPGTHTVCFTHVEGYTEPACQTVAVNGGAITDVTGSFTQRGSLRVLTSPSVASQIKVDGHPSNEMGVRTDIPAGSHTVCYGKVPNYDPPACQNVTVEAGGLTTTTGTFRSHLGAYGESGLGLLRAVPSPSLPSQISIQQGATKWIADSWGLNWLELAPGSYTVTFAHVQGYSEPAARSITITSGMTTSVTGNFAPRGKLRVTTSPAAPSTIQVDGVPRTDWALETEFPVGSHTVCFGAAAGYANTPACQTVTVNPGMTTTVIGAFR